MNLPAAFRGFLRGAGLLGLAVLAGCSGASYVPQPLSAADSAAQLTTRSLEDDGLRQFLARNLGREPAAWPPEEWSFEMLSWTAFYYNPSLAVARAQWESAVSAEKTAGERPNPTVSLVPGYSTAGATGTSLWSPAINLDFLLDTAARRDSRVAAQRLESEAARLNVLATAFHVRGDLRSAWIDLALAERKASLLAEQAGLLRQVGELLDRQRAAGEISALDEAAARTSWIRAEGDEGDAQRQVPLARGRLAQALGVPVGALNRARFEDPFGTAPEPPSPAQLAAARDRALQSRPDVLGALARYESSQASLQLEIAKQHPDVHLGPGYQYDEGDHKWTLALSFELPLFHPVDEGAVGEAVARRREAAAEVAAIQAQAIAEIDGAAASETAAIDRLAHAKLLADEWDKQSDQAGARFRAGAVGRSEWLSAQADSAAGRLALLDAEAAAAESAGQLEDALQVPTERLASVASLPTE